MEAADVPWSKSCDPGGKLRSRTRVWSVVLTAATTLLSLVLVAPAQAGGTSLPLAQVYAMVVDAAHGRVFLSGGPWQGSDTVVVTDADGNIERVLTDLPGASGMVLSPDGAHLYVALYGGEGIAEIGTSDLSVRRLPTGTDTAPLSVAVAAGLVWYWYRDPDYGMIGAIDPASGANTAPVPGQGWGPAQPNFFLSSGLWSDPVHRPNEFFSGTLNSSPSEVQRVSVTGGAEPTLTVTHETRIGANLGGVAFTPDGKHLITAFGDTYYHPVLDADDLTEVGRYETTNYPNAVAVRGEDGLVAAGLQAGYGPDVFIFGADTTEPLLTYEIGGENSSLLVPGGLAFGPGGRLYAVKDDLFDESPHLVVVHPDEDRASIDVTSVGPTYTYGEAGHLDVHLGTNAESRRVQLYQPAPGGGEQQIAESMVDAEGNATFVFHPSVNTSLTAVFRDTETRVFTRDSTTITVRAQVTNRLQRAHGTSGRQALFHHGQRPIVRFRVTPAQPSRHAHLQRQRRVDGQWAAVKTAGRTELDASGRGATHLRTYPRGTVVRVRAVWAGDHNNAKATGPWLHLRFTR